jgi:cytoskeleton protein RodZ
MASVGAYLRELRTRRGVSLDEIARTTRVAPRYLSALESDAFDELPAPVFIRGFIRAYCQALGESPHEALSHYDGQDGRVPAPAPPPAPRPRAASADPRSRGTIVVSFVLLVILGMALFTVALVLRPGDRIDRAAVEVRPEPRPVEPATLPAPAPPPPAPTPPAVRPPAVGPASAPASTAPPATAVRPVPPPTPPAATGATASSTGSVAAAPAAPSPAGPAAAPPTTPPAPTSSVDIGPVSAPYRLVARTSEPTWIRVRTEDGRSSEETVPAGEVREWVSDRPFVVTVGNAGGVSLELNGRTLPSLGASGVVVPRLVLPAESR